MKTGDWPRGNPRREEKERWETGGPDGWGDPSSRLVGVCFEVKTNISTVSVVKEYKRQKLMRITIKKRLKRTPNNWRYNSWSRVEIHWTFDIVLLSTRQDEQVLSGPNVDNRVQWLISLGANESFYRCKPSVCYVSVIGLGWRAQDESRQNITRY